MAKKKMTHVEAKMMLLAAGVNFRKDFHELRSADVELVLDAAKMTGYHKSKNAPGSRARMYYQLLERI